MAAGDNIKKNTEDQKKFNQTVEDGSDSFRDMRSLLEGINVELGKKVNNVKEASKGYSDLTSIASKLALQEEEITRYSDAQLKGFQEKSQAARKEIEERAKSLIQEKGINEELKGNIPMLNQILGFRKDLTEEQQALLKGYATEFKLEDEVVEKVEKEVQIRKDVNKSIGVAGQALKAINQIAGPFASILKLDKIQDDMEKFSEKTIRAGGSVSRLQTLGVGLYSAFKNAFSTLTDPTVIIGGALKGFKQVDKANVDFQRQTGQSLNNFGTAIDASNAGFITLSDYIKTASELTKELGQNAATIFTPDDLIEASQMTEAMGMASKEAAKLAQFSKVNGGNIREQNEAIVAGVNASNRQNKTAVAAGDVLKDVANTSEGIAISYAGYPEKLGAAAASAKALGMSLGDVDKIAGSLLDFEQSISNELEAELLTGRDLNLEKARELALNNDLKGVADELANQGITSAEFSKMNRIQQEAQAKALGMNRDEMAKMLLSQEMSKGLQEDALNDAQKQTLEQLKQQEASDKFQKSIEKVQQALAPIVGFFANTLSSITGFLTHTKLIYPILAVIATLYVAKMVKGFKGMRDDLKEMVKGAKDIAKNLFDKGKKFFEGSSKKGTDKLKETLTDGGDKAKKALEGAGDGASKAADKAKGVKGNLGKEIEQFLKGVGRGLKFIGQNFGNIALGGAALLLAAPGLIALSLSAPGLFILSMIPGPAINNALTGLGRGLSNFVKQFSIGDAAKFAVAGTLLAAPLMAIGLAYSAMGGDPMVLLGLGIGLAGLAGSLAIVGKFSSQIMEGSLALLVLGAALIPAAFAFSLLEGVDTGAIIAFSIALPLLALAAAGLGAALIPIIMGSAALAVLGLALIPASMAFSMLAGLDSEAIVSFATGIGILAGTVALLGLASPFIILGSIALTTLGLALIPVAAGFKSMAEANVEGLVNSLQGLALVAPQLFGVAAGLGAIAAGLGTMAFAGFAAMPIIGALTTLGAVSGALGSIFGGGEEENKKEDEMAKITAKLDELIFVVKQGGDVYLDGQKVGTAMAMSTYKTQ